MRLANILHVRLLLALVIGMMSVHFAAHAGQPVITDPEIAEYVAAGGSLADLCLSDDPTAPHPDCPLCREVESPASLMVPLAVFALPVTTDAIGVPTHDVTINSTSLLTGLWARAPPSA